MSGGSDSVINLWRDDTKEKHDAKAKEEEEKILLSQELSNHLKHKNYRGALRLAIALKQVCRCSLPVIEYARSPNGLLPFFLLCSLTRCARS